jgi:UTP--glucose-1-phosphate uridylyltransferase
VLLLDRLAEKPTDYTGEFAFVNISRAILPGAYLDYLDDLKPAANGEYQSTDAIQALVEDHDMLVHPIRGAYHDCGDPAGWLAANVAASRI